jgi:hypothetical protein
VTSTELVIVDRLPRESALLRVGDLVVEFAQSWRRTIELGIELGQALEVLKAELGHGNWLPWVEANFPLGNRMAERLMLLARNSTEMSNLPPETPITAALEWLGQQRATPRSVPEPASVELDAGTGPLLRFCQDLDTGTIVTLILRVAFPDAQTALDLTYGPGGFWDGTAHVVVTAHDVNPRRAPHGALNFGQALEHYDPASFDIVTLDPPHLGDASDGSVMGERFGTLSGTDMPSLFAAGARVAWRIARIGILVKVCDHVHAQQLQLESDWVRRGLDGLAPYEIVHQVRSRSLIDPRWELPQISAYNNGATFLVFRRGDIHHVRRAA